MQSVTILLPMHTRVFSRLRHAALALVKSLGAGGGVFLEALSLRAKLEEEPELRYALIQLVVQLDALVPNRQVA